MTTPSVFQVSNTLDVADGVVVGPLWTEDLCRELVRALRTAAPAPDDPEREEFPTDLLVAARVFHEVLTLAPGLARAPLFAANRERPSLFKRAVLHAHARPDLAALCRLSDLSALAAANVARWLLRLPQQSSATVVFSPPPGLSSKTRSRTATAREIALAS